MTTKQHQIDTTLLNGKTTAAEYLHIELGEGGMGRRSSYVDLMAITI